MGLNYIGSEDKPGLGTRGVIRQGGNSGYQAMNLAYLWGASRIVLLGFDCKYGPGGRAHWFGQHKPPLGQHQPVDSWLAKFSRLATDLQAAGVEVINASADTALTCFRRQPIDEVPA